LCLILGRVRFIIPIAPVDPNSLPHDPAILKQMLVDLTQQLDKSQRRLRQLLAAKSGTRSEQLSADQLRLFAQELSAGRPTTASDADTDSQEPTEVATQPAYGFANCVSRKRVLVRYPSIVCNDKRRKAGRQRERIVKWLGDRLKQDYATPNAPDSGVWVFFGRLAFSRVLVRPTVMACAYRRAGTPGPPALPAARRAPDPPHTAPLRSAAAAGGGASFAGMKYKIGSYIGSGEILHIA
jgi:hypothetical protein